MRIASFRPISPALFLAVFALVAGTVFVFPFGTWRDFKIIALAAFTRSPVVLTGDSVIKHFSQCDSDRRYISGFLATEFDASVQDLSYGGQSLIEQVAYLGAATRNSATRTLVAAVSLPDLMRGVVPSLRRRELFAIVSPANSVLDLPRGTALNEAILGGDLSLDFHYDGEHFPSYQYVKQRYMSVERAHSSCPETDAWDTRFLKAHYYGVFVRGEIDAQPIGALKRLHAEVSTAGKLLLVVIKPIDFELIQRLDSDWAATVRAKKSEAISQLEKSGVSVLDLSESLPSSDFADRWCACGHLQQRGRMQVGAEIAKALRPAAGS